MADLLERLIIVCCHAIWLGGPSNGHDEAEWAVESFQRRETPTFIEHIKTGLKVSSEEPNSLLVFSGLALARANNYFTYPVNPTHLIHDPYATESYQNILFPLIQFCSMTSRPPTHITIISEDFKRQRFLSLHVPAIRYPSDRVTFLGIDPPEEVTPRKELEEAEREKGFGMWAGDMYGWAEYIRGLREKRGWREEMEGELLGPLGKEVREEVKRFMEWKGGDSGTQLYPGKLPWSQENF
ncbi:MAG: hypothetical protein Q9202_000008 [Teloschistes flavicans]